MRAKLVLIVVNVLLISMVGCNLPSSQNNSQSDLAATITAQAMTIQAPAATPTALPASPAALDVSVSSDTNCRTGNNVNFDLVFTMKSGDSAPVVGKDTADNYWIIDAPNGGTCWLWGKYATINGDTSALPEISPPSAPVAQAKPTKTPKPSQPTNTPTSGGSSNPIKIQPIGSLVVKGTAPSAPTNVAGSRDSCTTGSQNGTPTWKEKITVTWKDNANTEEGYHVYRGNVLLSTLPANSTKYTITMSYPQNSQNPLYYTFGVEDYNNFGASSRPTWDVPTCP